MLDTSKKIITSASSPESSTRAQSLFEAIVQSQGFRARVDVLVSSLRETVMGGRSAKNRSPLSDAFLGKKTMRLIDSEVTELLEITLAIIQDPELALHEKAKAAAVLYSKIRGGGWSKQMQSAKQREALQDVDRKVFELIQNMPRTKRDDAELATVPVIDRSVSITQGEWWKLDMRRIDRSWGVFVQRLRREIASNPSSMQKLVALTLQKPLNESMPLEAITAFSDITASAELVHFLNLPVVSDSAIGEKLDIHVPFKKKAERVQSELIHMQKYSPKGFAEALKDGITITGISEEEMRLAAKRYTFARDLRMLVLAVELRDSMSTSEKMTTDITTSSGMRIRLAQTMKDSPQELETILDPTHWEYRKQLKDRVHYVRIKGKSYIMKERKSTRHTDQMKGGRKPLSSFGEFRVAENMHADGILREGIFRVESEKPLAIVNFPEESQEFVLFEHAGTNTTDSPSQVMSDMEAYMHTHPEEFKQEFEEVRANIHKYYTDKEVVLRFPNVKDIESTLLSYEHFIGAKYMHTIDMLFEIPRVYMAERGYKNNDNTQCFYRIEQEDGKMIIRVILYDFEYMDRRYKELWELKTFTFPSSWNGSWITKSNEHVAEALAHAYLREKGARNSRQIYPKSL